MAVRDEHCCVSAVQKSCLERREREGGADWAQGFSKLGKQSHILNQFGKPSVFNLSSNHAMMLSKCSDTTNSSICQMLHSYKKCIGSVLQ